MRYSLYGFLIKCTHIYSYLSTFSDAFCCCCYSEREIFFPIFTTKPNSELFAVEFLCCLVQQNNIVYVIHDEQREKGRKRRERGKFPHFHENARVEWEMSWEWGWVSWMNWLDERTKVRLYNVQFGRKIEMFQQSITERDENFAGGCLRQEKKRRNTMGMEWVELSLMLAFI